MVRMPLTVNLHIPPEAHFHVHLDGALSLEFPAGQLDRIEQKIESVKATMATEEQVNAKLDEVEAALTSEIEQIVAELKKQGVSDAVVARLDRLKSRISGIIEQPLPVEPKPAGAASAE